MKTAYSRSLLNTLLIASVVCMAGCEPTHIFSGRINAKTLGQGNVEIPLAEEARSVAAIDQFGQGDLSGAVVQDMISFWAEKDLPAWDIHGAKVDAPRILMAKLIKGVDVEQVNDYLLNVANKPWSESGSTWLLRNGGDYDFTEVPLTAILYKFGNQPELLYPETKRHLLNNLLAESGDQVRPHVPGTFNLVPDTENHILMTEGSRYLKNQWLRTREGLTDPLYDNQKNGVEEFLVDFLDELNDAGLFEFNSIPYSGYTLTALMNLEAFAEPPVSLKARKLLDATMFRYALGSLDMRRAVPFRRQPERAGTTSIEIDDESIMSRMWVIMDDPEFNILPITDRQHQAFYAAVMPYRIPDETLALIKEKESAYFVQLGRGPKASPEIFSGGPGYLLSAGGVSRGSYSMIVSRPITLMLSDKTTDYMDCFRIPGHGTYEDWNNTGVFRDFSVSNSPVVIPAWAKPVASFAGWRIYHLENTLTVAVFNDESDREFGIMVMFPGYQSTPEALAKSLSEANPDQARLLTRFVWPMGDVITYDVNSPKDKWVISSFNGQALDRDFDSWPDINSMFKSDVQEELASR